MRTHPKTEEATPRMKPSITRTAAGILSARQDQGIERAIDPAKN